LFSAPYCTHTFWGGWKLYRCDDPRAGRQPWSYPFIDVFSLAKKGRRQRGASLEYLFPSRPITFAGLPLRGPRDLDAHISMLFGAQDDMQSSFSLCASPAYDHRREVPRQGKVTFPCYMVLQKCFPHYLEKIQEQKLHALQ